MSLGKAMIHARKQKSIAKAAAFAGDYAAVQPSTCCRCRSWSSTHPTSPSISVARGVPWCWCSKALRALRRSTAHAPCPAQPDRHASVIRLLEYRRIPHQTRALSRKISCCAIATPANTAALSCLPANSPWTTSFPVPAAAIPPGESCRLLPRLQSPQGQPQLHEIDDMHLMRDPRPSRSTPAARSCACWAAGRPLAEVPFLLGNRNRE